MGLVDRFEQDSFSSVLFPDGLTYLSSLYMRPTNASGASVSELARLVGGVFSVVVPELVVGQAEVAGGGGLVSAGLR